jgi:hypothetical protein
MKKTILLVAGVLAIGLTSGMAQPANLSPAVQEVVKLTQAHMSDDVIVAYIHNSGAAYSLSADDILYLNSQGVSQPVISELLHTRQNAPAPASAPPPTAPMTPPPSVAPPGEPMAQPSTPPPVIAAGPDQPPPNSEVNLAYFQTQLAPGGTWVDVPGYGQCWRPAIISQNPDWRPYLDDGHWVYTDDGWTWQSDYAWGEIAFHYGRWFHQSDVGWVWAPGYNWGPAWVSWRHAEGAGFCGWAPLPPEARFEVGVGLTFGGHVGVDLDFGLAPSAYVFLPFDHFWAHDYHSWAAPAWRVDVLFRSSIVMNGYRFDGGHFVVEGLGRDRMALLTHHPVPIERVVIHDERLARSREIQHVRSAEVRHVIGHEAAARQEQDIHHDVRQVEAAHHQEAVHHADAAHQPARGGSSSDHRDDSGHDGDRNKDGSNQR